MKEKEVTPATSDSQVIQWVGVECWRWWVPRRKRTKRNLIARSARRTRRVSARRVGGEQGEAGRERTRVDDGSGEKTGDGDSVGDLLDEGASGSEGGRGHVPGGASEDRRSATGDGFEGRETRLTVHSRTRERSASKRRG
jgi:hypothetical protein